MLAYSSSIIYTRCTINPGGHMRVASPLVPVLLGVTLAAAPSPITQEHSMSIPHASFKALAPVLIVDQVEPCLDFWTALGFTRENEVPGADGKLVFASVTRDGVEVMYQTRA